MNNAARSGLVIAIAVIAVTAVIMMPPIAQEPAYHDFADQRLIAGIPNCWNVLSNLPFVLVGLLGIFCLARKLPEGGLPELHFIYTVFFIGVFLAGLGSAYYHYEPSNRSLMWDRLPMTLAFMAFFAIIIGERVSPRLGCQLFWPLIIAGIISVLYWHITEANGSGDLRPYVLVQFLPMLLIPLLLLLYKSRLSGDGYLWAVIVCYGLSKIVEFHDHRLYEFTGILSGHSAKHIIAATGAFVFFMAMIRRKSAASM